jgi:hypothetical protein
MRDSLGIDGIFAVSAILELYSERNRFVKGNLSRLCISKRIPGFIEN